ncbi:MAG: hypothetical protein AVDCRST_MAG68-4498, partial [uncultured Gemmatimonadetes bacterium]
ERSRGELAAARLCRDVASRPRDAARSGCSGSAERGVRGVDRGSGGELPREAPGRGLRWQCVVKSVAEARNIRQRAQDASEPRRIWFAPRAPSGPICWADGDHAPDPQTLELYGRGV